MKRGNTKRSKIDMGSITHHKDPSVDVCQMCASLDMTRVRYSKCSAKISRFLEFDFRFFLFARELRLRISLIRISRFTRAQNIFRLIKEFLIEFIQKIGVVLLIIDQTERPLESGIVWHIRKVGDLIFGRLMNVRRHGRKWSLLNLGGNLEGGPLLGGPSTIINVDDRHRGVTCMAEQVLIGRAEL